MGPHLRFALLFAAATALAGCMGGNSIRPLTPVPTTAVSSASLPAPISITQQSVETQTLDEAAGIGVDPITGEPIESAAIDTTPLPQSADSGAAVSEDDLIGAWSATTPTATCSLNLSLTSWQGGFRASTRNCGDLQVSTLTAWAIDGNQVLLKGADGANLARLFRTGPTRYAGQLETGEAVTLFR